jgi:hypothetical protein
VTSIFVCSFQSSQHRASSPSSLDSKDSAPPGGYSKLLDPRHTANKRFVKNMLEFREFSADTTLRLQTVLDTPSRPHDSNFNIGFSDILSVNCILNYPAFISGGKE